ncbi:hypothetical protein EVAR_36585_1 [Eumeta japonica]|uniref:Uncharacterized protein n=1 Tax=Eumeta variegata TaxID=151549 RepID=A0A4C1XRX5_EUMVA|nr:hypothetical protein EVAR_36585_1 [Eumeta japonica]
MRSLDVAQSLYEEVINLQKDLNAVPSENPLAKDGLVRALGRKRQFMNGHGSNTPARRVGRTTCADSGKSSPMSITAQRRRWPRDGRCGTLPASECDKLYTFEPTSFVFVSFRAIII